MVMGRDRSTRVDVEQVEACLARLEEDLDLAEATVLETPRVVGPGASNPDHRRIGEAGQGSGFSQVQPRTLDLGVEAEQHRAELLGSPLQQLVATKLQQLADLVSDLRIVAGVADSPRMSGPSQVDPELEVDGHGLGVVAFMGVDPNDAIDLEPADRDGVGHRATLPL